nr:hypothetical protein [uncultured Cetobacterium sp.]
MGRMRFDDDYDFDSDEFGKELRGFRKKDGKEEKKELKTKSKIKGKSDKKKFYEYVKEHEEIKIN